MEPLQVVLMFSAISTAIVDKFFKPIRAYAMSKSETAGVVFDFATPYVAWVISGALVYYGQVNLIPAGILSPALGVLVTAVVSGFGSNAIHDLLSIPQTFARELAVYREAGYELDEEKYRDCLESSACCSGEGHK